MPTLFNAISRDAIQDIYELNVLVQINDLVEDENENEELTNVVISEVFDEDYKSIIGQPFHILTQEYEKRPTQGHKIKKEDIVKVMGLANRVIDESNSKADTKSILRTFVDKITFDKESKDSYTIYTHFTEEIVDRLNELTNEEPTAGKNAVGSFTLIPPMELVP